jgi:hypothetical protein
MVDVFNEAMWIPRRRSNIMWVLHWTMWSPWLKTVAWSGLPTTHTSYVNLYPRYCLIPSLAAKLSFVVCDIWIVIDDNVSGQDWAWPYDSFPRLAGDTQKGVQENLTRCRVWWAMCIVWFKPLDTMTSSGNKDYIKEHKFTMHNHKHRFTMFGCEDSAWTMVKVHMHPHATNSHSTWGFGFMGTSRTLPDPEPNLQFISSGISRPAISTDTETHWFSHVLTYNNTKKQHHWSW